MTDKNLREILKGNYSILNSQEAESAVPDREKILSKSSVKVYDKGDFKFGQIEDLFWFEGTFIYPRYTSQDVGGAVIIYDKSGDNKKIDPLEERLSESVSVFRYNIFRYKNIDIPLPILEPGCIIDLEFCLPLVSQKIRKYVPNEQEVEQLIEVAERESCFSEQIAAIEILSNSKSLKAYYFLNQLVNYKISVECVSGEMEKLFPAFYEWANGKFEKTWTCPGISKKVKDHNKIFTPYFKQGKVEIDFMNSRGLLRDRLNKTRMVDFRPSWEAKTEEKQNAPMRCNLDPGFHWDLYSFVFNAQLKIRKNLGENFDKKEEFRKISFF